jgi:hypothetical protein
MSFAGKWVGPEIIMVREISQTEKDKHHMFSMESRQTNKQKE